MKKLETYESESHRNLRKTQRRREIQKAIAQANGFETWYRLETAVIKAAESGQPFTINGLT